MNVETRPLSFFLQKRAKEQDLQKKIQKRKARLEEKKKEEKERRKTLYDKSRRSSFQKTKHSLKRVDVFFNHIKKNLNLSIKTLDEIPEEFESEKDLGLLSNMISQLDSLQKKMSRQYREIETTESKELREKK